MIASLAAYVRERGRPGILIPAAILIALGANAGHAIDLARLVGSAALVLLLLAQFRLWDDLADLAIDRSRHPERLLSRAAHVEGFVVFVLLLATANVAVAAWLSGPVGVVILLLLNAATAVWYAARSSHRTLVGDLIILTKYPVFVFVVAGSTSPSPAQVTAAIATYAAACVFDVWHDASSPLRRGVNA
jgi:4-hydroxybenzoate polyprenyltransferase